MRTTPSVFLETTVLKASKGTRLALLPEPKRVKWGAREFEVEVHRPVFVNQNVKYLVQGNYERFGDTVALRFVAALAKEEKIHLLSHNEVFFELMGLPRVAGGGPWFYGAPIRKVKSPIQYDRIIVDASGHDYQYEFLSRLNHPRFRELQTVCGAFQGHNRPLHRNQLIDAFHMWCAESSGAMYLLTLDDRLIRTLGKRKMSSTSVTPITPKRLLVALASKHPIWLWSMARERMRITHSGRKLHEAAQDASREFWS